MIYIIDHGSQYTGLIGKGLEELSVKFTTLSPHEFIRLTENPSDISAAIISGSPKTISEEDTKLADITFTYLKSHQIPTLGVCFGFQLMAQHFGSTLVQGHHREYGNTEIKITVHGEDHPLFIDIPKTKLVWMSHGNSILPSPHFDILSNSHETITSFQVHDHKMSAVLYHPEVTHTEYGDILLKNFVTHICKENTQEFNHDWNTFLHKEKNKLQGISKVICATSGGVDSTVLAVLLSKYCEVHAVYIDHGLQREYDLSDLKDVFKNYPNIHLHVLDEKKRFMNNLKGVKDPEDKRKIIGKSFIDAFAPYAKGLGIDYFAQGTIASDIIESGKNTSGTAQKIKSHHNVGGLPQELPFTLIEPLKKLYKDQVRSLGLHLNIPLPFIKRHPFPGPGLAIRCLGELHESRIDKLRKADGIFYQELQKRELYHKTWQAGVILLPIKSTGVMGDENSYEECLAIRMVDSVDAMTADVTEVPWKDLKEIANKIVNHVKGINRVVYDITSKPPATIEWE